MRIGSATYRSGRRRRLRAAAVVVAAAAALAGCGDGQARPAMIAGKTLTIYASLPRHGVSARAADATAAGERLALADAHGRIGKRRVRLIELDSSDPAGETWDPSTVEENARRAVADPTTIAYLGELSLGGSAISVPITNGAGILQVSTGDGLTSLTRVDPASLATGPQRYYPSGVRNFQRLVPTDLAQAAALASWAHDEGATSVAVVQDGTLFGRALAADVLAVAPAMGLTITDRVEAGDDPAGYPGLAASIAQKQPNGAIFTGVGAPMAGPLLAALERALPGARLYGSTALAAASPAPPAMPPVEVLAPSPPPARLRAAGRRVLARLRAELDAPVEPDALYGYEAMQLVLDTLRAAGRHDNNRLRVTRAGLRRRMRHSVVGDYELTGSGDVATDAFAAYRLDGDRLSFLGMRSPGAPLPRAPSR